MTSSPFLYGLGHWREVSQGLGLELRSSALSQGLDSFILLLTHLLFNNRLLNAGRWATGGGLRSGAVSLGPCPLFAFLLSRSWSP